MDRYQLTVRPGTDFRMSFRLLYEDDQGVRSPLDIGADEIRLTICGGVEHFLTEEAGSYLAHLDPKETSLLPPGNGTYVIDRVGADVERLLEGAVFVSHFRSEV